MNYICELHVTCDMYVESCTILVICLLNRDPSRYSTDYRVYLGLSMIVRPLVGYHCTCALMNWSVCYMNEFDVADDDSYMCLTLFDSLKEIRIELEDADWWTWKETSN